MHLHNIGAGCEYENWQRHLQRVLRFVLSVWTEQNRPRHDALTLWETCGEFSSEEMYYCLGLKFHSWMHQLIYTRADEGSFKVKFMLVDMLKILLLLCFSCVICNNHLQLNWDFKDNSLRNNDRNNVYHLITATHLPVLITNVVLQATLWSDSLKKRRWMQPFPCLPSVLHGDPGWRLAGTYSPEGIISEDISFKWSTIFRGTLWTVFISSMPVDLQ